MLRRRREQQGITLKAVADETKIGSAFLTALERGDCSKWPGGIYSRAWIRAYATAIGLDPDEAGATFTRCFTRSALPDGAPAAPSPAPADRPVAARLRLTIEPEPHERMRVVRRRALLFMVDVVIAMLAATAISALTVADFWATFAGAALTCHAVGLFGGGGSASGWIDRSLRRYARPHDDPASESAMAEA